MNSQRIMVNVRFNIPQNVYDKIKHCSDNVSLDQKLYLYEMIVKEVRKYG